MKNIYITALITTSFILVMGAGCTQSTPSNTTETVKTNSNTVVIDNTNTDQGSDVDTSDWKTYTDDFYISGEALSGSFASFSIQYPSNWLVDETLGGPVIYTPSMQSGDLPQKQEDFVVSIGNFVEDKQTSYNEVPLTTQDCVDIIKKRNAAYSVSNINFIKSKLGIDAVVFDYTFADTTSTSRLYCLVQDDKAITVSGSPVGSDLISTFMVMIDSLKFN